MTFSRRELEIAQLIDQHHTFDEIAAKLGVSYSAVKYHADRMRLKLGVKNARGIPRELKDLGYTLKPPKGTQ